MKFATNAKRSKLKPGMLLASIAVKSLKLTLGLSINAAVMTANGRKSGKTTPKESGGNVNGRRNVTKRFQKLTTKVSIVNRGFPLGYIVYIGFTADYIRLLFMWTPQ